MTNCKDSVTTSKAGIARVVDPQGKCGGGGSRPDRVPALPRPSLRSIGPDKYRYGVYGRCKLPQRGLGQSLSRN